MFEEGRICPPNMDKLLKECPKGSNRSISVFH
jgi:hypothetical protein